MHVCSRSAPFKGSKGYGWTNSRISKVKNARILNCLSVMFNFQDSVTKHYPYRDLYCYQDTEQSTLSPAGILPLMSSRTPMHFMYSDDWLNKLLPSWLLLTLMWTSAITFNCLSSVTRLASATPSCLSGAQRLNKLSSD